MQQLYLAGESKIQYEIDESTTIEESIGKDNLQVIFYITIALLVIGMIYWAIQYQKNGIFAIISYISTIAVLAIILRYVNVIIALETIVAFYALLIANYSFINKTLKQIKEKEISVTEAMKNAIFKSLNVIIPLCIIAVAFTFMGWLPVFSIGMVMFWGIIAICLCNYFFTKHLICGSNTNQ